MIYLLELIIDDYAKIEDEYKHVRVKKEFTFENMFLLKDCVESLIRASAKPIEFKISKKEEVEK